LGEWLDDFCGYGIKGTEHCMACASMENGSYVEKLFLSFTVTFSVGY
jgi:hypothetical protein